MDKPEAILGSHMRRVLCLLLILGLCAGSASWVSAVTNNGPSSWVNPAEMALKRVGSIPEAQQAPIAFDNLDCQLVTYRLVNSSEMRSGCFTSTAFGMMDSNSDAVIFNGTDEGIPLMPKGNGTTLVPWPNASTIIVLNHLVTGDSYISLYSSPLSVMQDERNALLQLTAKKFVKVPDIQLKDSAGQRLVINAGTIAISDGGSWLVAETLTGSFVRVNLATLDTKLFASSYPSGGLPSRVAVSDDGRYVAIQNRNYEHFKVHDLSSCVGNTCSSYNYHRFVGTQVQIKSAKHLRFINKDQLSIEVIAQDSAQSGVYHLAPRGNITSMTDYIGLGDSYTSGEGAFNYQSGTDTEDNMCHQSVHAYPALLTRNLFTSAGGHSIACSGARINDLGNGSDSYGGQTRNGLPLSTLKTDRPSFLESIETSFLPGYVAQQRFVKRWQPEIITVSIGGNDIGFGDILEQCVIPKVSRHHSDSTCFNTFEDRVEVKNLVDRTVSRWTALFKQLKAASPATQIYTIGYPDVIDDTGNCAINVKLGKSELVFAKELVAYINERVEKSANDAGVAYIDISRALVGHRLCETKSHNVAVNGLTAGRDSFVFGRESYHPNALGHQLIAQEILRKTNNLTLLTAGEAAQSDSKLLNAPRSNRAITNRQPAVFTDRLHYAATSAAIRLGDNWLRPNTTYQVRLDGPSGRVVGSVASDAQGNVASNITIPADTTPGSHTIDIVGDGQTDKEIDVTQPIYIPESPDDIDGDDIPNSNDSCFGVVNSGYDVDRDDIDDVCDPLIDDAPPSNSESTDEHTQNSSQKAYPLQNNPHVIASFNVNNERGLVGITSSKIYHAQGVDMNNRAFDDRVSKVNNTNLREQELVHKVNPWILWWVYLLVVPFALWSMLNMIFLIKRLFSKFYQYRYS